MMKHSFCKLLFIVPALLILNLEIRSQTLLPFNRQMNQRIEREYLLQELPMLSPAHNYYKQDIDIYFNLDSVLQYSHIKHHSWFNRKLWDESFVGIDSGDFSIHIDPLFNLQFGKDKAGSKTLFTNTRGGVVQGNLGKKFAFGSWFYEDQAIFPQYWDVIIDSSRVAPGQGRAKRYQKTGWDYAYSGGYISWRALKNLNIEFGQGKNFIGNGYRSLLLSDVSTNYPYLRIDWTYKRIRYTKMFTAFTNFYYPFKDIREFYTKTGTIQLLSIDISRKWQVSFFEMNIWNNPDSSGLFNWNPELLNPIPYMESVLRRDPLKYNGIDGINLVYQPINGIQVYGQLAYNKTFSSHYSSFIQLHHFGYQVGMKYYDPLKIKNGFIQLELNQVQPNTFSQTNPFLSGTHFQQPLGHPLGANFREFLVISNYRYKRFFIEIKSTFAKYGADIGTNRWGKDLLKPYPEDINSNQPADLKLFQGMSTKLFTGNMEVSYYINPKTNMNLTTGIYLRYEKYSSINNQIQMFYVAFRTSLSNLYNDY
jgi:hypothetical protein